MTPEMAREYLSSIPRLEEEHSLAFHVVGPCTPRGKSFVRSRAIEYVAGIITAGDMVRGGWPDYVQVQVMREAEQLQDGTIWRKVRAKKLREQGAA